MTLIYKTTSFIGDIRDMLFQLSFSYSEDMKSNNKQGQNGEEILWFSGVGRNNPLKLDMVDRVAVLNE